MTQRERQILKLIEANPMISQQALAQALGITRSSVAVHISNLMKKGYIAGKGYVLRSGTFAAVIGGMNIDIGGCSSRPLVPADSNPGHVQTAPGGVGRNIAHNLSLLGIDVHLLTAYGDDFYGQKAAASCSECGIDLTHALCVPDAATSTYLYLAGPDGDMALAVSDMEICERITPDYLRSRLFLINRAQVAAADANIPEESLIYLAENCTVPLFCDPVSTGKAGKLLPVLGKIHTLKPNRLEAELLSGIPIRNAADAARAADRLLSTGLRRVFISMGADGVFAADHREQLMIGNFPGRMVNTSGCGDAFMAALIWSYLEGTDLKSAARAGLAAASVTMESGETVSPGMSPAALKKRMNTEIRQGD